MAPQALDNVVSHWSTLIEGLQTSPLAFYQAVEAAGDRRSIPNSTKSRVDFQEGGVGSAKREYLRIERENLLFDVCGAPFGTGFFVSWWLSANVRQLNALAKIAVMFGMVLVLGFLVYQLGFFLGPLVAAGLLFGGLAFVSDQAAHDGFNDNIVRALPLIGSLYVRLFRPATFYRIDSMEMFQTAVHNSVLEVVDALTAEKGIRALSESERKPVMRAFYDRKTA